MVNNTMETESENLDCGKLKRRNNQFPQQTNCKIQKEQMGAVDVTQVMGACLKCMEPWVPSAIPHKPVWCCMVVIPTFWR